MTQDEKFEGAENAERAKEKADSQPTRHTKKDDNLERSVDLSKESKEAALAKVDQERKGPGKP